MIHQNVNASESKSVEWILREIANERNNFAANGASALATCNNAINLHFPFVGCNRGNNDPKRATRPFYTYHNIQKFLC